ncbi:copper amine oxidase N-terminal domain-containing protein [Paenibacillus sp.]|uniref:copper amine oxidase N-terminal domain-containing protein n=1 Tax=Paenibacillus sp. TaxID=58172 RepID=UPI0028122244|nr:copper amine oxidase N-terminal domain-containing protein [Paenibacillus sp.]
MKKTITSTAMAATLLATVLLGAPVQAMEPISGYTVVKSFTLTSSTGVSSAYQQQGYVMAPVREIGQALGWDVMWDGKTKEIKLVKGDHVIRLVPNQPWGTIDSNPFALTTPVVSKNNIAYAPLRALAARMGAETLWDAKTGTASIAVPNASKSTHLAFDFSKGDGGWKTGVADLPVDYQDQDFQISAKAASVTLSDGSEKPGMMLSGMNRSDDLFMFMSKKLGSAEGLKPNTEYEVKLRFDLATSEAESSMGIGGSPASSVYVKAGVVDREPSVIEDRADSHYRLNLDKGNQSTDGKEVALLGNLAKPDAEKDGFQMKRFEKTFQIKSNANGELYVLLGTDSGYEGLTTIYFTNVDLTIEPMH